MSNLQEKNEELEAKLRQACLALRLAITVLHDICRVLGIEKMDTLTHLVSVYSKVQP
jgi:hypothetical protein